LLLTFSGQVAMISADNRYVVFDFETTGLSPYQGGRVIEIGAVKIENGRVLDEYHSLVNPGVAISRAAQQVHGISMKMLEPEPEPMEVFPSFLRFIEGAILVAHNASFDMGFLRTELRNLNAEIDNSHLCTLKISRKLFPGLKNYKLETVARHLVRPLPENLRFHRALDDAHLTAKIWLKILQLYWQS
jgi:DNA polymerase III epsilon subunit